MTTRRWISFILLFLLFGLLLPCAATFLLNVPTNRVIQQWHQPQEVDYQSHDPYTLSVIEGSIKWTSIPIRRRHYLFIGKSFEAALAPTYGHFVDYDFHSGDEDVTDYIERSNVEWTPEGITFIEESGHRLFIPKAMFIGGR